MIVLMFFSEPAGDGRGVAVHQPSLLTSATIARRRRPPTLVLGVVPGPVLDLAGQCGSSSSGERRRSTPASGSAFPVADAAPRPRGSATRLAEVEEALSRARRAAGAAFVDRGRPPPDGRRRQAVPAAAGAAGRRVRRPRRRRRAWSPRPCVVELTHLASLYHDDVMDEADAAPRRRSRPTPAGTTTSRSSPATSSSRSPPSSTADLGPDAVRIQAQTFTRLVEGQIRETVGPAAARTRSSTTSTSSPTRPAR